MIIIACIVFAVCAEWFSRTLHKSTFNGNGKGGDELCEKKKDIRK